MTVAERVLDQRAFGSQPCRPNLFILGAPKAGTTALATYLAGHPEVFVADKELHYFGSDLEFRTRRGDVALRIDFDQYLAWFAGRADRRYRGDRSVFYLFSDVAGAEIVAAVPEARAVALLRNPVDQMHSEHSEMVFQGDEDIIDFATALAAEEDRAMGERIPPGCQKPFGLLYRRIARYAPQLERAASAFGAGHLHVVLHEDLVADPAATYRTVLDFLEVEPSHRPEFAVVNANKTVRSRTVRRLLTTAPHGIRRAGRMVVRDQYRRAELRRRLQSANTRHRPRPTLDPSLRRRLLDELADDIDRTEVLLDRDLSRWRAPEPSR